MKPTYEELLALLIRAEDALKARAPNCAVLPDISKAIVDAGIAARYAPAPMRGLAL